MFSKQLEEHSRLLAADIRHGWAPRLPQMVEVEGLALHDEAALKGVAHFEACVLRCHHLKVQVAVVFNVACAVGMPGEPHADAP